MLAWVVHGDEVPTTNRRCTWGAAMHKADTHFHRTREAVETALAVLLGLTWGGYAVLMLL